jgi:serine/threonine protein phosphatase PrpC
MSELRWAAHTDVGKREHNEDTYCTLPELGLFAVADGMGGYEGGEVASRLVVEALAFFFERDAKDSDATWPFAMDRGLSYLENLVRVAVKLAHERVCAAKHGMRSRMGSTVAVLVLRDGQAVIGHVGDSRIYRLRDGSLEQLTEDHSLYAEMKAQAPEQVPPRSDWPYGNVITRAVGMAGAADPEVCSLPARPGDRFLLCTDGLSEPLGETEITEILAGQEPDTACQRLVSGALDRGGRDNVTALVVAVDGDQPPSPSSSPSPPPSPAGQSA